jgi:peroxiredoxin
VEQLTRWTAGAPPSFILPDNQGAEIALAAQRGDAVLVHFFATRCEPCLRELPALSGMSDRGGPSLKVVAISVAEPSARVARFLQAHPVSFPVLLDNDRSVARAWNISSLPTTVVLNARLEPKLVVDSDFAWDRLDPKALVERLSQADRDQDNTQMGGLLR